MAQDLANVTDLSYSEPDCRAAVARTREPRMMLCSRTKRRERWYVEGLVDRPRRAAAVELVLQTEEGVKEASVNPLTGRVLVLYDPRALADPVEVLLRRALKAGPLSREEFSLLRPKSAPAVSHRHLLAAEIGCSLVQMILLGGLCPIGVAGAALLFLVQARRSQRQIEAPLDCSESALTN